MCILVNYSSLTGLSSARCIAPPPPSTRTRSSSPGPTSTSSSAPNGSGKSTIVNGICLGLAGKTSVLGRATSLAEFIKLGEQEAAVEVELFVPDEENVVISRRWNQENKSQWAVRGRKTTQKEVEKVVAHFRIQVDNLCQFLPQDKVHDFSRQNSRGLLDSTVDAVGDAELKTKHQELKEMQKTIGEGEDLHDRKKQMLKDKKERCERLEEEVKAFEEKKKIEEKIRLLEGRLAWSKVNEVKKEAKAKKETKENLEKQLNKEEKKLDPLKAALKEAEQKKKGTEAKIVADNAKVKESRAKAQTHSKNIESNEKQIKDLDDQLEEVGNREEEKKAHVVKLKTTIAQLEAESDSREGEGEAVGMEELEAAKRAARQAADAVMDQQQDKETVQHGLRGIATRKDGLKRELDNLRNVDTQKLQILKAQNVSTISSFLKLSNLVHLGRRVQVLPVAEGPQGPVPGRRLRALHRLRQRHRPRQRHVCGGVRQPEGPHCLLLHRQGRHEQVHADH